MSAGFKDPLAAGLPPVDGRSTVAGPASHTITPCICYCYKVAIAKHSVSEHMEVLACTEHQRRVAMASAEAKHPLVFSTRPLLSQVLP
jgi:hypothetical protein